MFGTNEHDITKLKTVLNKEFRMKDLGLISDFLGINVHQNLQKGITILSQKNYLQNVLQKFKMENCKPVMTPMDQNFNSKICDSDMRYDNNIEKICRQMIGCLMYAVSGTRPDLCYAISILSRYQNCANKILLSSLKRLLRYVKHTINYSLIYKCNDTMLECFCDADWGGDQRV